MNKLFFGVLLTFLIRIAINAQFPGLPSITDPGSVMVRVAPLNDSYTNGLAVVWNFEETGTGNRVSSEGYALSLNNVNSVIDTTGIDGLGIDIERNNNRWLEMSSTSYVAVATTLNFSVSGWIKLESHPASGQQYGVITKRNPNNGGLNEYSLTVLYNAAGTKVNFATGRNATGTTVDTVTWSGTLNINQWYFLSAGSSATYGSNWISVDGAAREWAPRTTGPAATSALFRVGILGPATHLFDGVIDLVAFWRVYLTDAQLASLSSNPPPVLP